MPLVSYNSPLYLIRGILKRANAAALLQLYPNRHAGLIAKRITPNPFAPTPTEVNLMNVHKLVGPLHTEQALTPGDFLKATGPANFAFTPHGLTAPDVGALPVAAQAADSDKLDGQHANEFLPIHGTADAALDSDKLDGSHANAFLGATAQAADSDKLDGSHASAFLGATAQAADSDKLDGQHAADFLGATAQAVDSDKLDGSHAAAFEPTISAPGDASKIWDGTKTFRYNDRLVASDGSPNPALSADAAGNITAVANFLFGAAPSTLSSVLGTGTQATLDPSGAIFNIAKNDSNAKILRLWFGYSAYLTIQAPSANSASAHADLTTSAGHLKLAPATGFVGINNNAPAAALDVTGAIKASSTLTLPAMSSAGFVKNSAAGLLSGGNALVAADIPATLNPTAVKGAAEGATPLDIRTASATFGAGNDISLLTYQDALKTSNATPQTILTIPIPTDSACTIDAILTVTGNLVPTHAQAIRKVALFRNAAGSVELCGGVTEIYNIVGDISCSATITVSGTNALVMVTGEAATDFHWACTATRHITYIPAA